MSIPAKKLRSRGAEFFFRLIVFLSICAVFLVLTIASVLGAPFDPWDSWPWLVFGFSVSLFFLGLRIGSIACAVCVLVVIVSMGGFEKWAKFFESALLFSLFMLPFWVVCALFRRRDDSETEGLKSKEGGASYASKPSDDDNSSFKAK